MADFELVEGISALDPDEWNALVGDDSPFLEWEWLASLEEAGTLGAREGWLPRPLVAREGGRLVAACPLYVKGHSEGEFVFDWGWADAAERAGIRYYPKLLVGVPFTPVTGRRLLTAPDVDRDAWLTRLATELRELCLANELSSVHVNFCREDEADRLAAVGFKARIGVQYHWANDGYDSFEDYLSRFRSKRRNQIRREMREVRRQGARIETLIGEEIPDSLFPRLYDLYLSTIDKNPWGRRYLNPPFFELLRQRYRDRIVAVLAWIGDELVAGAINVQKGDALYGRYWGCLRELRNLHFDVCYYSGIAHCIVNGLSRFEPGAGGSYKQIRGFDAYPTYSAHFVADPRLAEAVDRYLRGERTEAVEAIREMRERSALKPPIRGSSSQGCAARHAGSAPPADRSEDPPWSE